MSRSTYGDEREAPDDAHHDHHAGNEPATAPAPQPSVAGLVAVWAALMGLLGITWGSAYVPMGAWNTVVNVAVAVAKATLVLVFFMRLRTAGGLARLFGVTGFGMLALLIGLSLVDRLSR